MTIEELIAEARKWNDRIGNPLVRSVLSSAELNIAVTAIESALIAAEAAQADLAARDAVITEVREWADSPATGTPTLSRILAQSPADALAAVKAEARVAAIKPILFEALDNLTGDEFAALKVEYHAEGERARTTPTEWSA